MKSNENKVIAKPLRYLLIAAGWFFVALGVIGIFLPVMPTTIFLLIAASLFAKSSEKFYNALINNKYLGSYIRNYREHKGMTLRSKITAIVVMNLSIGFSAFYAVETTWVKIVLLAIAVSLTIFFITIKTIPEISPEEK